MRRALLNEVCVFEDPLLHYYTLFCMFMTLLLFTGIMAKLKESGCGDWKSVREIQDMKMCKIRLAQNRV
jgi:hypothetical protein